jgi:hypothetical protein
LRAGSIAILLLANNPAFESFGGRPAACRCGPSRTSIFAMGRS